MFFFVLHYLQRFTQFRKVFYIVFEHKLHGFYRVCMRVLQSVYKFFSQKCQSFDSVFTYCYKVVYRGVERFVYNLVKVFYHCLQGFFKKVFLQGASKVLCKVYKMVFEVL